MHIFFRPLNKVKETSTSGQARNPRDKFTITWKRFRIQMANNTQNNTNNSLNIQHERTTPRKSSWRRSQTRAIIHNCAFEFEYVDKHNIDGKHGRYDLFDRHSSFTSILPFWHELLAPTQLWPHRARNFHRKLCKSTWICVECSLTIIVGLIDEID